MVPKDTWEKISTEFTQAKSILILNPKDSDGDSLGASLALAYYLKSIGKNLLVFAAKPPSGQLSFLTGFEEISSDQAQLNLSNFDLVVTVDFADLKMLDLTANLIQELLTKPIINIDHHPTNFRFGKINVVEPEAASTTELLFYFFEDLKIPYDKHIATCLLTGIIYDTGSFAHLNTTQSVIEISAKLLIRGARLKVIIEHAKNKPVTTLKLWGVALSRLTHNPRYELSSTVITKKDIDSLETNGEAVEGIANFLNNLAGPRAVLVLKEGTGGKIKGSLRSTVSGTDVSRLAALLGGGGHKKSAGFTLTGKLIHAGRSWQVV